MEKLLFDIRAKMDGAGGRETHASFVICLV